MMMVNEKWAGAGSAIASFMFAWAMAKQFFPRQFETYITRYTSKIVSIFYPYIVITFPEHSGEHFRRSFRRSEAYTAIESYLSGTCTERAKKLKAEMGKDSSNLVLSMDEYEEVADEFQGVRVKWHARKNESNRRSFSLYPPTDDSRYYTLVFHKSFRKIVTESYLQHVMEQGKIVQLKNRTRKLYTNSSRYNDNWIKLQWSHVAFEHPATFNTVAIDPKKKEEIVEDLLSFSQSKDYYLNVGKPWKRGYLLYGPPGTGKSTMIAAMANLLDYDVYDLELTAVKDNTDLRKLLIETTSKSIIVIEDIDCSLDLSGKRKNKQDENSNKTEEEKLKEKMNNKPGNDESKVTLSGLLNFIDGLWSACGSERLIVFTTNYVEKLDQALIRRGRMDMHIELSYCRFEAFKVLAKNYLGIDDHALFEQVKELMEKNDITPADVAENLMPKTLTAVGAQEIEKCLKNLIQALNECKKVKDESEEQTEEVKTEDIKDAVEEQNEEVKTKNTKDEVEENTEEQIEEVKTEDIKDAVEEQNEEVKTKDTKDEVEENMEESKIKGTEDETEEVKTKDEVEEIKVEANGETEFTEDAKEEK